MKTQYYTFKFNFVPLFGVYYHNTPTAIVCTHITAIIAYTYAYIEG